MRNAYKILFRKLKLDISLGRTKLRSEDNIIVDHKYIRFKNLKLIYLAQDRDYWRAVLNMMMNIRVP
jgi:hypothetical protein